MARSKSIQDIINQRNRISRAIAQRAEDNGRVDADGFLTGREDIERYRKVDEAAGRYINNIHDTKRYQRDFDAFDRASSEEDVNRTYKQRVNRQYSQRTYMGLAKG